MFKVVSLFSGCGGADQGIIGDFVFNKKKYEGLPFELVYATDIDQKALNSHMKNFKCENVVCKDICETKSSEIPECDIIVGGFPCQSFSTVNPTKDPFDDRANLYKQMVRIVRDKQPKIFIAENVKGMMTLHKGQIFNRIIKAFEEVGYTTYTKLFNAADYGVPQRRERVIIVGIRNDLNDVMEYEFPKETNKNNWVPLSVAVPKLAIEQEKYYFSERAVQGMKNAKNNMKRGLYQDLNKPSSTANIMLLTNSITLDSSLKSVCFKSFDILLLASTLPLNSPAYL